MAQSIGFTSSPNADKLEVCTIDVKKNRSLVTKARFAKDETLFTEKPIVSAQFAWNQFYNYRACEFCMRPLENAQENVRRLAENASIVLPHLKECCETYAQKSSHCRCETCGVEYCSRECQTQAFATYHQSLCCPQTGGGNDAIAVLMDYWRQIHLPPETTTIYIILKLMALTKQSSDKMSVIRALENFDSALVNEQEHIPHKLLSEKFFSELENLRALTLQVFESQLYVKEFEPCLTPEGFRRLFSLIGRNSQGIGTSPFSTYVNNVSKLKMTKIERKKLDKHIDKIYSVLDKTAGSFLNSEGSGLYSLQSMINHSCKPNAQIVFQNNNNELSIVALEELAPGAEVLISYLDDCALRCSRHTRQKILQENYLFKCECERCVEQANDPDVTSDEDDEELEEEEDDDDDEYEDIDDDDNAQDDNNNVGSATNQKDQEME